MNRLVNNLNGVLFQLKWVFMSQEARYAYLWNRTRSQM